MRRKSKPIPKATANDDRKVGEISKKAGLQEVAGMEEANIIFENGDVTQIRQPKVRGLLQANAFVVHGATTSMKVSDLTPDMQGNQSSGYRGAGNYGGMPGMPDPSIMQKLQQIMQQTGIKPEDFSDPSKAEQLAEAMKKAGISDQDMSSLVGGDARGEEADDVPP